MSQIPNQPDADNEQGISLDELSRAYANAMGPEDEAPATEATELPEATTDAEPDSEAEPTDEPVDAPAVEDVEPDDDPCPISPETIFEAMLFVGDRQNEPLPAARAAELMRGVEPEEIPQLVERLNRGYTENGCPYQITSEGTGYRLGLRNAFDPVRNRFYGRVREAQLSQAAIDVLAIVAYRQPLTSDEVSRLRGTPSGHVLAQLVRRRLLCMERTEGKRKPAQYQTTDRFLDLFGLESLDELPQAEDLDSH